MSDNKTIYVLFIGDYHPIYVGVFSSEKEACRYAISEDQGFFYVNAYRIDTNEKVGDCERANKFFHWCDWDSDYGDLFEEMEYEDAKQIQKLRMMAKFNEVFGD